MHYEEKLIDGYWCFRHSPRASWTRFTLEAMGEKFHLLELQMKQLCQRLESYRLNEQNLG
jgi:hypothetical protein